MTTQISRAPAMFVQHGGGPMPLLNDPHHEMLIRYMKGRGAQILAENRPKAIVLVTAHWETDHPSISSGPSHPLYYDYYGFPPESYAIKYPAPGSPQVAKRVQDLLTQNGFKVTMDEKRGWDHGVFVPMVMLRPQADIPIVQLSVLNSQDANEHLRYGQVLSSLRDEGVAVIGSGMTFHNMRTMMSRFSGQGSSKSNVNDSFEKNLSEAFQTPSSTDRIEKMKKWEAWTEHFMPALVVAGAGGDVAAEEKDVSMLDFKLSSFAFLS
ncbi:putative aromatic ring-opening dioxygenase LigB subunit [Planoprotostelium fungivorum]|uniref:Putative aromatic ring-opening dioxygenase LigB subunit n=1 Tax=Planoprotostelium fungivorum TaxID=1890364 RepID=A0A2P6NQJ3_9EUKA|nr:putative aromatic ring-opening dioxygenase LigB subunit [Planoprotostelium fungivorum]